MKYREVTKKLKALGCIELSNKRKGSHRNWYNPNAETVSPVPVPNWGQQGFETRNDSRNCERFGIGLGRI